MLKTLNKTSVRPFYPLHSNIIRARKFTWLGGIFTFMVITSLTLSDAHAGGDGALSGVPGEGGSQVTGGGGAGGATWSGGGGSATEGKGADGQGGNAAGLGGDPGMRITAPQTITNGVSGVNGTNGGKQGQAGGGGGGGTGIVVSGNSQLTIQGAVVTGGVGGSGGPDTSDTGSGGGGAGVLTDGSLILTGNGAAITGGAGGTGQTGGSSGGGGGTGVVMTGGTTTSLTNEGGSITGGVGGRARAGGGGGAAIVTNANVTNLAGGSITGGDGGLLPSASISASGGGGAGILVSGNGQNTVSVVNNGVITGGNGGPSFAFGNGGAGGAGEGGAQGGNRANGWLGDGGAGIKGANLSVVNAGAIKGGVSGAPLFGGGTQRQANAVAFTGGVNRLELQAGWSFVGNVVGMAGSTNTLALGGDTTQPQGGGATVFDVSQLVPTGGNGQFQGFSAFEKTGASTWQLTGTITQLTPWKISGGTLSVSSDGALGDVSGVLTLLNNATLATTASISTLRNIVLGQGGGNIDVAPSTTLALSGVISGQGALTKSGDGLMLLTGTNTYSGGTTIARGTLQLGDGGSTGSLSGNVLNNGSLVIDRNDTLNVDGQISGSGNLTQAGTGTTILTADNSYTGATAVSAGTLIINGNQSAATGLTTVNTGATLGGNGTLGGSVAVADGATLAPGNVGSVPGTLTIQQNLRLSNGSLLDYHFGQAGVPGGALNDLVKVHGDLTLDGTINVKTTPGGSFDPGIYRVFTYDGNLTNNGLQIGTIPSPNYYVQTSVQKQVNLINTNGLTLSFWDGANGGRNDGIIDGGDGLWQNSRGNSNWTTWSGSVNAPFSDAAFAVFTASPGTVRVDNSLGQVTAGGMQFDANGYHLTGDAIQLAQTSADSPASVIRVGNGTTDGAVDIATIDNTLFGDVQLRKTDLGTLVLNAANTYTGGTAVDGGTLVVGDINHQGAGLGAGDVTISDSGTLSGTGVVAGHVTNNGTVAALNALSGQQSTPVSNLTLANGLTNNGTINLAGQQGQAGNTLTVKNDYVGNQGQLILNTFMGNDTSASDRLVLDNAKATGNTAVVIKHAGGNGAQTQTGILLVDARNGSTTDPNAFFLSAKSDGYRKSIGTIASGAYDYSLVRGGNGGNADSWYLTSLNVKRSGDPDSQSQSARPSLRPEIGSYIDNVRAANTLFAMTLYDRLGNAQNFLPLQGEGASSFWIRNVGGHNNADAGAGAISTQANRYVLQMGGDVVNGSTDGRNRFLAGVMGGYANEHSNSVSQGSGLTSKGSVNGYSVGVYGTWYANGEENQGGYVDSWALYNWFDNRVEGEGLAAERYTSKGMTASLETGYTHKTGEYETFAGSANDVFIQPKAQVIWMGVTADNHTEQNGTQVSSSGDNNVQTRLGFRAFLKGKSQLDTMTQREFEPFAEVNWIHNTSAYGATMDGVNTQVDGTHNIGEIKVGVEGKINRQLSFWGNVAEQLGGQGYNDTQGTLGMRYSF